jgi:hypothetical protein
MLRHFRPSTVLEFGAGFSSALILDVNEHFLDHSLTYTIVEPFTERLRSLMRPQDEQHVTVIEGTLQQSIDLALSLRAGDLLFVDSSHVARVGSDVNALIFNVLPNLEPGVLVHIHDVHFPFEYPENWIFGGRAWTEAYLLRAFLEMNSAYEILLFNSYLGRFHFDDVAKLLPEWRRNPGGSIWLRRIS